jgi:hypothetical protein
VAGGRKPAQPSIPEGILGFPPPDAHTVRTKSAILKSLKTNQPLGPLLRKKSARPVKISTLSRPQVNFSCRIFFAVEKAKLL